jgi:hypothetical protein
VNFSDYFEVTPSQLATYGAFNVSLVSDLPLFIDPFLLFNSTKPEYQELHESILKYLTFLRDKTTAGSISDGLLRSWFCFKEIKENWLGFTVLGNGGRGLGMDFARSLRDNLDKLFPTSAQPVTQTSHLEKVSLISGGVGRDSISDFTTNLIKEFLLDFTQTFTLSHVPTEKRHQFRIRRVKFNYTTESWADGDYTLPTKDGKFVLLTPDDMITGDETWINRQDMIRGFSAIPPAITDPELREQVSNYFEQQLRRRPRPMRPPTKEDRGAAAGATIQQYPELMDYYIALKELSGDQATDISSQRVNETDQVFVEQLGTLVSRLESLQDFYQQPVTSFGEAMSRVRAFKQYVENQDGWQLVNKEGRPFSNEKDLQLYFGLAFTGSAFDVNREPNNGRGPVDFSVSRGAYDKSLIEFKLGSNSQLKRNLQKQVAIYEAANRTSQSVTVIVNYTAADERRVQRILRELGLANSEFVVVIDARSDNKPSASTA